MDNKFSEREVSFKKVFESFRHWPKILRLVYKINSKYLMIILTLNILTGMVPALNLYVTQELVNSIVEANIKGNGDISFVIKMFFMLIGVGVGSTCLGIFKRYYEEIFQKILTYDINVQIMDKASNLSLMDFDNPEVYDKIQRAQKEAGHRPFEILKAILTIISAVVTLISSAMFLILWKWWVAIILIVVPIFSTSSLLKQGQREFQIQWKRAPESRKSWYITYLLTKDNTFKEIKLYNLGEYLIEKYGCIFRKFLKEDKGLAKRRSILTLIFDLINQIVVGIVTGMIIISTVTGEILVGNLVGYLRAVGLTQANSMIILNTLFRLYKSNLYITQLLEFLEMRESESEHELYIKDNQMGSELKNIEKIEFKNVSFKYPNANDFALKNVSFTLNKNESVAIVGENGSGKTTLVKLITGLYEVTQGDIFINDISIKKISRKELRENIGVALQDFIKYQLSVRENIGFGDLRYIQDDEKLRESAEYANINGVIDGLENGLENRLGVWFEGGVQLSGGQWQRIALARAFLKDSGVYVLDEPSAALDPLAEKEIFDKFYGLTREKIGIFISHRFSSIKKANRIFVLNRGELIEEGTHEELMNIKGRYEQLYSVQAEPYR